MSLIRPMVNSENAVIDILLGYFLETMAKNFQAAQWAALTTLMFIILCLLA